MQEIKYYLGIDGGGTKTDFAFADAEGNILSRVIIGGCNPNDVGFDETFRVLTEGIYAVKGATPFENISVFAGLAGCSSADNLPRIREFLGTFGFGKSSNHNDAYNAVSAGLGVEDGVAVIMGTGSIAYAKNGTGLYRIGGYGYLFGDSGSGFAIGRDTILAALQYEDGMGEYTVLHPMVKSLCGGDTVLSKIDMFYEKGKKEIAKYARLAFDGYELNDAVATDIIKGNLRVISDMIKTGGNKIDKDKVNVCLLGGLTAREEIIIPILQFYLKEDNKKYNISVCKESPVMGALYLAGMKK